MQPAFVNARRAGLLTQLTPEDLLTALRSLEKELGREPPRERWGPRVIDLDLLVVGARDTRHRVADSCRIPVSPHVTSCSIHSPTSRPISKCRASAAWRELRDARANRGVEKL